MKAAEREAALNAAIARHPAGKKRPAEPAVVFLPADLTCMHCEDNQALPGRLWCTTCAEIVDQFDADEAATR